MKKVDFGTIAFCAAGLFSVVEGLIILRGPLQMLTVPGDFRPPIATAAFVLFLPPIILLLFGIILIAFASKFANKLLPDESQGEVNIQLRAEDIQAILFSFAGVLLIGFAIGPTLDSIARLIDLHNNFYFGGENQLRRLTRDLGWTLAGGGLQLLLGLLLFFQRNTRQFLRRLRPVSSQGESQARDSGTS